MVPTTMPTDLPPFASWPDQWADADTRSVAAELHAVFAGFLDALAAAGRSRETITAHTANLWLLGGESMAFFRASPANRARGVDWFLSARIAGDEPPIPKQLKRKADRNAYLATVRALLRFVRAKRMAANQTNIL